MLLWAALRIASIKRRTKADRTHEGARCLKKTDAIRGRRGGTLFFRGRQSRPGVTHTGTRRSEGRGERVVQRLPEPSRMVNLRRNQAAAWLSRPLQNCPPTSISQFGRTCFSIALRVDFQTAIRHAQSKPAKAVSVSVAVKFTVLAALGRPPSLRISVPRRPDRRIALMPTPPHPPLVSLSPLSRPHRLQLLAPLL